MCHSLHYRFLTWLQHVCICKCIQYRAIQPVFVAVPNAHQVCFDTCACWPWAVHCAFRGHMPFSAVRCKLVSKGILRRTHSAEVKRHCAACTASHFQLLMQIMRQLSRYTHATQSFSLLGTQMARLALQRCWRRDTAFHTKWSGRTSVLVSATKIAVHASTEDFTRDQFRAPPIFRAAFCKDGSLAAYAASGNRQRGDMIAISLKSGF